MEILEHLCITSGDIKSYTYCVKEYTISVKKINKITIVGIHPQKKESRGSNSYLDTLLIEALFTAVRR